MLGKKAKNLIGQKFEKLTVIERAENSIDGRVQWLCECECGNKKIVRAVHLKNGGTKSCGCWHLERSTLHSGSGTKLYKVFLQMNQRCYNPNDSAYKNYGGRGIITCPEWKGGENFINFQKWALSNGYEEGLTLERVNVNRNYQPDNCKWATRIEQANNKRNNAFLEINGVTKTFAQWSKEYNLTRSLIRDRIRLGWIGEELLRPANIHIREDGSIGVKGVYWHTKDKKWYAYDYVNGKQIYIGCYSTEKEAIEGKEKYLSNRGEET